MRNYVQSLIESFSWPDFLGAAILFVLGYAGFFLL